MGNSHLNEQVYNEPANKQQTTNTILIITMNLSILKCDKWEPVKQSRNQS